MPFVISRPVIPPEAPPTTWPGVEAMSWLDAKGESWDLLTAASPVRLLPGVRGLGVEQRTSYDSTLTGLDGQRHRGSRAVAREVFWPVLVRACCSNDFVALDDAWWDGLSAETAGVWSVMAGGRTRRLTCRWAATEDSYDLDPVRAGRAKYGVSLVADDPWWRGDPITRTFTDAPPYASWFGASTSVFQLSSANTLAAAAIDNPGDVDAWVDWTITGPCTSVTVGVGSATIQFGALTSGQSLTILSAPGRQSVRDGAGVSRLTDVVAARFAPVPAGSAVPLAVSASDTSSAFSVKATLVPGFRKAWGRRG